jgi:hypothetical protein
MEDKIEAWLKNREGFYNCVIPGVIGSLALGDMKKLIALMRVYRECGRLLKVIGDDQHDPALKILCCAVEQMALEIIEFRVGLNSEGILNSPALNEEIKND